MHFCIFSKGAYFVHRDKWIGFTLGCPAALVVLRPYSGSWGGHWTGGNDRVKGGMWDCGVAVGSSQNWLVLPTVVKVTYMGCGPDRRSGVMREGFRV